MTANQIKVEWANGNQQWCIVGGGLPPPACWDAFSDRGEAIRAAEELAEELGLELIG